MRLRLFGLPLLLSLLMGTLSIAQTTNPTAAEHRAANEQVRGDGVVFPVDANVRNVRAYGAKGDGVTDDTEAVRAAYQSGGITYFPNGTYLIRDQIKAPPRRGSAPSRRIIQGQSREGVILKLADGAEGFTDPANPRAVLITSWGVAQGFRNAVRDITIDIGKGNPGAIALDFFASNTGQVENVTLRSSDPERAGHTGLQLKGDNGPLLVKNLRVEGFEIGILAGANQSSTFDGVTLRGQRKVGMGVENKTFVHDLTSENSCPAITTKGQAFVLQKARLAGATEGAALTVDSMAVLRDVVVEGYPVSIRNKDSTLNDRTIRLWTSTSPIAVGEGAEPLALPVKPVPEVEWDVPQKWVSVASFKPATITVKHKGTRETENWASALQQAIDSGATTVYFPAGRSYEMSGPIYVRGNVRRIIGMEAEFRPIVTQPDPLFVVEEGAAPVVTIERFDSMYGKFSFRHAAKRTLVLQHLLMEEIVLAPGAGDLFVEDIYSSFLDINGQNVWARQFNMEHSYDAETEPDPRPNVRNVGGTLWLFGLKTEQNRPKVVTTAGGKSEVVAYILANRNNNKDPMFINQGGRTSVTVVENVLRKMPFPVILRDIRGATTTDQAHDASPRRGEGVAVPLVTAGR